MSSKFSVVEDNDAARRRQKRKFIGLGIAGLVAIITSFVIGYLVRRAHVKCPEVKSIAKGSAQMDREDVYRSIVADIDSKNIKGNLRYYAAEPHMGGSKRNNELADDIYNRFENYGFQAERNTYDVLLSFPEEGKRNFVYSLAANGSVVYRSLGREKEPADKDVVTPFNGYSPNGTVEGEPIYVNYGRREDFDKLKDLGFTDCRGKVVLVKYGKIFRGNKVRFAEKCGAIGVVIFMDPEDYGPVNDDQLFPKSIWLPRRSVQRGTVYLGDGDPLTPNYPAKEWVYRIKESNAELPKIPVQPISAFDALHIIREMDGVVAPNEWKGMLNTTYRLTSTKKLRVEVHSKKLIKKVTNVIGTIPGSNEPDRYVMMGNHRDAWVYGAVDPSSGTAIMMEVARAIGNKLKTGWRPLRTIKFFSWDAEEYGLIGSYEYIEEFHHELSNRGVAYINIDSAVTGNETLIAKGSPSLRDVVFHSMKKVTHPENQKTLYDDTLSKLPDTVDAGRPRFEGLGSGSDFAPFYQIAGVACIDYHFGNVGMHYPSYHTIDDSIFYMEKFLDPGYGAHLAVARVSIETLLRLSNEPVISFNSVIVADTLEGNLDRLLKKLKRKGGKSDVIDPQPLQDAIKSYKDSALKLERVRATYLRKNDAGEYALKLRMLNDIGVQLENAFLSPGGLPGRESTKNYIMATASTNTYSSSAFPSIVDLLFEVKANSTLPQLDVWDALKKEFTVVALIVEAASNFIKTGVQFVQV